MAVGREEFDPKVHSDGNEGSKRVSVSKMVWYKQGNLYKGEGW